MSRYSAMVNRIVLAIEKDVLDRRGLKRELRQCDPDVRKRIRDAWRELVARELRSAARQPPPSPPENRHIREGDIDALKR